MKCPVCGKSIAEGIEVCPLCASNLVAANPESASHKAVRLGADLKILLAGFLLVLLICSGIAWKILEQTQSAAQTVACQTNLAQIALGLHNYNDKYGAFPPAVVYSGDGKPMHSWRVLILPFIGERKLYEKYDLNEPWDSTANSALVRQMPACFRCPAAGGALESGMTNYAAVAGPNTVLSTERAVTAKQITDRPSMTLMVVEIDSLQIPWTQPADIDFAGNLRVGPGAIESRHEGGFHGLMVDGTIRSLPARADQKSLKAASTIDGGEKLMFP